MARGDGRVFQYDGRGPFWIQYYAPGPDGRSHQVRETSGSEKRELAEALLKKRLREVAAARAGEREWIGPSADRVLVGDLLDAVVRDYRRRGIKSLDATLAHLAVVRKAFGSNRARSLTSARIEAWVEEKRRGLANATVNRRLEIIRRAFRLAQEESPPRVAFAPKVRMLRENNARRGFFEAWEVEALANFLPEPFGDLVRFAHGSGWRRGEIVALRWQDVEREGKEITLRDSKNGEGRLLPINGVLSEVISRRWAAREYVNANGTTAVADLVFHQQGCRLGNFTRAWRRACKAAGCPGRIFHDLRRSAVRSMIRAGVPQQVAKAISGHKTDSMFHRYNITSAEDLREAMARRAEYDQARLAEGGNVVRIKAI